ncbi:MAG: hypothetical protein SF097_06485 [Acidobacteriota bacterium]|nr:hypothetical protein [Acidobacteriota bacterium]
MKHKMTLLTSACAIAFAISLILPSFRPSHVSAQIVPERGNSPVQCTNGVLNGRYGYEIKGTLAGVGPVVLVGTITHSYDGTYTGAMTASYNGQIVPFLPFNGNFAVNSDCSGTSSFALPDGTKVTTRIVVVERGKEYFIINTDPGNVLSGVIKRID